MELSKLQKEVWQNKLDKGFNFVRIIIKFLLIMVIISLISYSII